MPSYKLIGIYPDTESPQQGRHSRDAINGKILEDNIDALHTSAEALLEHETIEGKHIHEILDEGKIISPIINSSPKSEDEENDASEADENTKEQDSKEDDLDPGVQPAGVPA